MSRRIDAALPGFDDLAAYRSLFAAYPDALLVVDAKGSIALANPASAALLGYRVDELRGMSVEALVPAAVRDRHVAYREAYARNPRTRAMGTHMDLVARRRDGSEVMVEIALSPLGDGELRYVVAAIRGISEYPRVKQALQRARYAESIALLGRVAVDTRDPERLLEQVPRTAVDALEVEGCAVLLGERGEAVLNVAGSCGTLSLPPVGAHVEMRAKGFEHAVIANARAVVATDEVAGAGVTLPDRYLDAGARSALGVPLLDRGRTVGALIACSGQPQRFGEDEVRFLESLANLLATSLQRTQTEEQLRHSQRMDSVGQLTGGIAHDFNNLLTVISGNLQVLEELDAVAEDALASDTVRAAMRATRRAAELTSKLLAFSRRQVLQPSRIDVEALLRSLAAMLQRTLDQRIAIRVEAHDGHLYCVADAAQLEAALLNVAINARDAMPDGGSLTFRCAPADVRPAEPGEAPQRGPRNAYVSISIADTGAGMPSSVRDRAFEPFFTTKEAGRGTGLGLSTVYGFAKQSSGAVTLESTPGAGTTVTLYLPRFIAEDDSAPGGAVPERPLPAGLHALVVEDDDEVRAVVTRFLRSLHCNVTECSGAEEAIGLVRDDTTLDVVITDIALGAGMRGTELADVLQRMRPALPVLLTTGFSSAVIETPPGRELLRKPYARDDLARAVARVIAGHPRGERARRLPPPPG